MLMRLINLDRSRDRLASFRARNPARNDIVRFPAVDGALADRARLIANEVLAPGLDYTDGALGCALSHLTQWRDVIQSNVALTVIEDDAILAANFVEEATRLIDLLPDDWEYVMWGYNFDAAVTFDLLPGFTPCQAIFDQNASRRRSPHFSSETIDTRLFRLLGAFGTACYSISPRGARRLLDFCMPLRPLTVQHPSLPHPLPNTGIDSMIAKAWPSMTAYVAVPPLAITDNENTLSTVQVSRAPAAVVMREMLKMPDLSQVTPVLRGTTEAAAPPQSRIPRILHYVFGMAADFGGKPWGLVHHACLSSAIEKIKPEKVFFHYAYEPSGPWWEFSRKLVTLKKIAVPTEIYGNPLLHVAHRAGVTRLRVLLEHGGIYLDADVLVHRAFDDLMHHSAVMGIEGKDQVQGLADAVILAEPGAPFIRTWLESYRTFRSKGRDEYWAEHAVWMPARIAQERPGDVHVLPHTAFFWPLWTPDHLAWMYDGTLPVDTNPYANHLWEAVAWPYFKDLTPGRVRQKASNFHTWLLPYIASLPDDYGLEAPASRPEATTDNIDALRLFIPTRDSENYILTFYNHYKKLGIDPLYIVDSRSVDKTYDLLVAKGADVRLIQPKGSFGVTELVEAACGFAKSRWVLRIDDDEFPSKGMLDFVAQYVKSKITNNAEKIGFGREWIKYRDGDLAFFRSRFRDRSDQYDVQFRLFLNDGLRFEHNIHTSGVAAAHLIEVVAPSDCFVVHFDAILKSTDEKLAKIRRYEKLEPGSAWRFSDLYLTEVYLDDQTYLFHRREIEQFDALILDLPTYPNSKIPRLSRTEIQALVATGIPGLAPMHCLSPETEMAVATSIV